MYDWTVPFVPKNWDGPGSRAKVRTREGRRHRHVGHRSHFGQRLLLQRPRAFFLPSKPRLRLCEGRQRGRIVEIWVEIIGPTLRKTKTRGSSSV